MNYDTWLQEPYINQAKASAAIERMIEQVLQEEEYDPTNWKNFLSAIDDAALYAVTEENWKAALTDPEVGHASLGKIIYEAVYNYYYKMAENEAARRYNERLG